MRQETKETSEGPILRGDASNIYGSLVSVGEHLFPRTYPAPYDDGAWKPPTETALVAAEAFLFQMVRCAFLEEYVPWTYPHSVGDGDGGVVLEWWGSGKGNREKVTLYVNEDGTYDVFWYEHDSLEDREDVSAGFVYSLLTRCIFTHVSHSPTDEGSPQKI